VENVHNLREGVLEGYDSMINGLKDTNKLSSFKAYVMNFLNSVKDIFEAAVSVVGDLISVFQQELMAVLPSVDLQFLVQLVEYAGRCQEDIVVERAKWLHLLIQKHSMPKPH